MDSAKLQVFTLEDLKACTNSFDKKNQVGAIQFAKLYRAKIKGGKSGTEARDVLVKIWDKKSESMALRYDEVLMVEEEVELLTNPMLNGHPTLAKLIGYCCGEEVEGVVYDLSPRDTLHNLIVKGYSITYRKDIHQYSAEAISAMGFGGNDHFHDDLNWPQRINVMLELARLLKFLRGQDKPHVVFNINASHIMLDWDFKPKLIDFGQMSKRIIGEVSTQNRQIRILTHCIDPSSTLRGVEWETSSEVFSFGVILLGLIAKRTSDLEKQGKPDLLLNNLIHIWAKMEYKPQCSLVHKSLQEDWGYHPEDGVAITELGMHCIEFFPRNRPTMKDAVERLESLHIFRHIGDSRPHKRDKRFHDDAMCM